MEILIFIEMLNCLYRIPYKIWVARLFKVTKMADYYCCLPAVSHNLFACFSQTDNSYVSEHALRLLEVAYKLRQPLLFKDCLIHVAGHMPPGSAIPHLCNKVIWDIMMKVRSEICQRVIQCQRDLMTTAPTEETSRLLGHCWESGSRDTDGQLSLPRYYRLLANHHHTFATILEYALENELCLPSTAKHEAGGDNDEDRDRFYCGRLLDEDLPVCFLCLI